MANFDRLRELSGELGFWPATDDEAHIAELPSQSAHYDLLLRQDPDGSKWHKMVGRPPTGHVESSGPQDEC